MAPAASSPWVVGGQLSLSGSVVVRVGMVVMVVGVGVVGVGVVGVVVVGVVVVGVVVVVVVVVLAMLWTRRSLSLGGAVAGCRLSMDTGGRAGDGAGPRGSGRRRCGCG